jgi:hypothetical protein
MSMMRDRLDLADGTQVQSLLKNRVIKAKRRTSTGAPLQLTAMAGSAGWSDVRFQPRALGTWGSCPGSEAEGSRLRQALLGAVVRNLLAACGCETAQPGLGPVVIYLLSAGSRA